MTTLVVCLAVVGAWFTINLATIIFLVAISHEQTSQNQRLELLEGKRGLDIMPPPDDEYGVFQLVCRREAPPKESA